VSEAVPLLRPDWETDTRIVAACAYVAAPLEGVERWHERRPPALAGA
jgi:hypothetical protein